MHVFRALLRRLRKFRFHYEPLIEVRIYRDAILHNLNMFKNLDPRVAVAPVLKSNAYGHGLVEVARIVEKENVPFICVDSYFEALILRNEDIRTPILIIGYTPLENILEDQLKDLAFGIISIESLQELSKSARTPTTIHLKIDTGMRRHGILPSEADEAIALIKANPRLGLQGVYSHLADADIPGSAHTTDQIKEWNAVVERFRKAFPRIAYFHCAATSGSFYSREIDANVVRLGIGLYGVNTSLAPLSLRGALEIVTKITSVRTLKKGEAIGYNATFTAPHDMRIATIPTGYNEGVDRRLSNKGSVTVRDNACSIVGRVSMNITSIDVSHIPEVPTGECVTVVSADDSALNSVEKIAKECRTIPYDILVHIPAHLRRTVVYKS